MPHDDDSHRLNPGHPPRLQHSPSLPNLSNSWADPHDPQTKHHSRKSTPAARVSLDLDAPDSTSPSTPTQHNQLLKIKLKSKTHPHLLTPPLTPSSSLKSEGSGTENSLSEADTTGEESEHGPVPPSRFLRIGNIPTYVSKDSLKTFFFSSFASHSNQNTNSTSQSISNAQASNGAAQNQNHNPIKGIFARLQPTRGVVVLAFYDLRDADRAKTSIEAGQDGVLDDRDENEGQPWERSLTCDFITPRELGKLIGRSLFVSETIGGFFVSSSSLIPDRVFAPQDLKNMLGSFGDLCQFVPAMRPEVTDDETQIFWVEYFDVRDADNAKMSLNGRTMMGFKLRLSSRNGADDDGEDSEPEDYLYDDNDLQERHAQLVDSPYSPLTPTATSYIPFPSSPQDHQSPAEHQGNANTPNRERFQFLDKNGRARPRSISADNDGPDSAPGLVPGSVYPASPLSTHPNSSSLASHSFYDVHPQADSHRRRSSNYLFFDAVTKQTPEYQGQPRSLNADIPTDVPTVDEQDTMGTPTFSSAPYPQHHQQHTSYYYNTPHDTTPYYASYYNTPSPALPHPLPTTLHFPLPPSSPTNFAYHPEPANLHNWTWTSAAPGPMTNGPAPGYYVPAGPPPVSAPHGMYYSPPQHLSPGGEIQVSGNRLDYNSTYLHPADQQSPHRRQYQEFVPSSPIAVTLAANRLSDSPEVSQAALHTPAHAPGQQPERNQLNLARIEDGQDTRTTVMVKNIPNKMSDKDLIAYIGNVCPRKIDFLYLRMDFQNECNVGYAFVNFITVEDLLIFAKSRLGVKWNMFSSEKVLQMSYANYQGKEALVEKFKNSCIMDEREAWRPKIFHSEPGPQQGMPEPFPAPTHIRRKERSSMNRGALFIPGTSGTHHLHNVATREQRFRPGDEQSSLLEPNETDTPVDGHRETHYSAPMPVTSFRSKRSNQHQTSRSTR